MESTKTTSILSKSIVFTDTDIPSSPSNIHHLRDIWSTQPPEAFDLRDVHQESHPTTDHPAGFIPHFPLHLDPVLQLETDPIFEQAFLGLGPSRTTKKRGGSNAFNKRVRVEVLSPNAAALFQAATAPTEMRDDLNSASPSSPASSNSVPRLPPILQVEKRTVTTSATQAASASRRRNEAHYQCPVPGCGSTFTRRFNLRGTGNSLVALQPFPDAFLQGHLRSHTEERPFVCEWPGCGKGFARQHDCKYAHPYFLHYRRC